jgi:UDP:flavonoid glycosyltransferase YjiC (YdhE family)
MRVAIVVSGTRGGVQPMLALAAALNSASVAAAITAIMSDAAYRQRAAELAARLAAAPDGVAATVAESPRLRGSWPGEPDGCQDGACRLLSR